MTPQPHSGLLISFDGIDSSGKETQVKKLTGRLRALGHSVHHFQTPDYTTSTGKQLKKLLQSSSASMSWQEKMKLFAANRAENKAEVTAILKAGDIVMYDRYVPSSLAFIAIEAAAEKDIAAKRANIQDVVARQEYETNGMPRENISIFLDVPPRLSAALLERRKTKLADSDEYTDHISLQERLYNEYNELHRTDPERFLKVACVSHDRLLGINDVSELVWQGVRERFSYLVQEHA